MTSTWITVGGLALTAFVALVAIRPRWFATWRVARHHGPDDVSGYTRLGDASPGSVRLLYGVLAGFFLVATFVVRGWAVADERCDVARSVYDSARDQDGWREAAEAEGMSLTTQQRSGSRSWTTHTLTRAGQPVASWSDAGGGWRFECGG
ncbi:hypothetical protein GC722_17160 [Auraticoccus sp. F435]|uniref:Uncharacterized protein n=1 Tax=Auraticoccus cholistanensis TaxID=2656650 RepID=A0A6A9V292_9ACTN|nr:hypothetical protein [Auraticoccus cholistanensis]MVA77728.1 hypothetical protein [Auraticoccus cholistanensis]